MNDIDDAKFIAALRNEKQIERLMLRFARGLDLGDWTMYRACFTDPVNIDFKRLTGFPEVRVSADLWTRFAKQIQTPVRRHHSYSNMYVDIEGDRATANVYFSARVWRATDLGATHYVQFGWYDVWFANGPSGWLIERLKHDYRWIEGNASLLDMSETELAKTMQLVFCDAHFDAARTVSERFLKRPEI